MPAGVARAQDELITAVEAIPATFRPGAVGLAIKPQMAGDVLPALGRLMLAGPPFVSILAGLTAASLTGLLGGAHAVVRAIPNTPAAIGQGMTVAFAGPGVTGEQRDLCHRLLAVSGDIAWLDDEALIDPVTSVSGCGPA